MARNKLLLRDTIVNLEGNPAGKLFISAWQRADQGEFSLLNVMAENKLLHSDLAIGVGRNPLTYAVEHRRDLIPALVSFGLDVNSSDDLGDVPLQMAVDNGDSETVKMLVDAGAIVTEAMYNHFLILRANAPDDMKGIAEDIWDALADPIKEMRQVDRDSDIDESDEGHEALN